MLQEERVPYQVGLRRFRQRPKFVVRQVEVAKNFGHEIMVGQQLVETPQEQLLEGRIIQVCMNIHHGGGFHCLFDMLRKWLTRCF